jgi:hypothetical protein
MQARRRRNRSEPGKPPARGARGPGRDRFAPDARQGAHGHSRARRDHRRRPPAGRPTLCAAAPGCGKTLLAMEFLMRGAIEHGEPGVFCPSRRAPRSSPPTCAPLGFDLRRSSRGRQAPRRLRPRRAQRDRGGGRVRPRGPVHPPRPRLDSIGAKRVVLDTIETLFGGLDNGAVLRSSCAGCSLAQGRASRRSSPASAARAP